jgi:hypothetical protein
VKRSWWALAAAASLGGCTETLPPPAPDIEGLLALRSFEMAPAAVGQFTAAGPAAAQDRGVTIRAGTFRPPEGTSWAGYLGDTLKAQLGASGKLDPQSPVRIDGELVENRRGENFSNGKATIAAQFRVRRGGSIVFDKRLEQRSDWDSNYFGFVAYEAALRHYTALYPKLVEQLLKDPEFRAAVKP